MHTLHVEGIFTFRYKGKQFPRTSKQFHQTIASENKPPTPPKVIGACFYQLSVVAGLMGWNSYFIKKTIAAGSEFPLNRQMGFIVLRVGSYSGTINIVYFNAYNLTAMTTIYKAVWLGNTSEFEIQIYKKENTGYIYVKNNTTTSVDFEIFIA